MFNVLFYYIDMLLTFFSEAFGKFGEHERNVYVTVFTCEITRFFTCEDMFTRESSSGISLVFIY